MKASCGILRQDSDTEADFNLGQTSVTWYFLWKYGRWKITRRVAPELIVLVLNVNYYFMYFVLRF